MRISRRPAEWFAALVVGLLFGWPVVLVRQRRRAGQQWRDEQFRQNEALFEAKRGKATLEKDLVTAWSDGLEWPTVKPSNP